MTAAANIIWKTPEEVDAIRLQADYARMDRGGWVTQLTCALGSPLPPNRGHKVEPPALDDESQS
jgi:hypothetical protein